MSKQSLIIIAVCLIIGAVLGVRFAQSFSAKQTNIQSSAPINSAASSPVSSQLRVGIPQTLEVSRLNIKARIESVGQDSQGRMDVPKQDMNVAWYNLGAKPGERGNAVLAGHFDTPTGAPAIFYYLSKLQAGDELTISDDQGQKYKYKVVQTNSYDSNKFPLQEVFGSINKSRLNLITCEGVWNPTTKNYSQRLVVYSELIQ